MTEIIFRPIGIVKTEFESKRGIPVQVVHGSDKTGRVEIYEQYVEGLKDLDDFSHIHLLYHFHNHKDYKLTVIPYLDTIPRGLFSTRAPKRPNGIGMSLVEVIKVRGNIIEFRGVDMINNTPLLDIKPYFPLIDTREGAKCGWFDKLEKKNVISDNRF